MSKVYLPTYTSNNCIVIYDKDTIRVYDSLPQYQQVANYKDYYINSHYLVKEDSEVIESVPSCELQDNFTTNVFYRNDLMDIMVVFIILVIICFYFPYRVISRCLGKWAKF